MSGRRPRRRRGRRRRAEVGRAPWMRATTTSRAPAAAPGRTRARRRRVGARRRLSPTPSRCGWPTAAASTATACRRPGRWSTGGPIDVLTGDWLAELTMLILAGPAEATPTSASPRTFLTQMEQVLGTCLDRGIKVVSNAGGLEPGRAAPRPCRRWPPASGCRPKVAYVEGDDLLPRLDELRRRGRRPAQPRHRASAGRPRHAAAHRQRLPGRLGASRPRSTRGADVVITGRVTDAALVVGPAAWRFGWARTDWDAWPARWWPGTSSSAAPRAPAATTPSSPRSPAWSTPGFPIAEMPRTARRGHQAPGHRRAGVGRHGDGAAALRDRRAGVLQPRRGGGLRHRCRLAQDGPDRVAVRGRASAGRRRRPRRWP